jgi:hypothetical protein
VVDHRWVQVFTASRQELIHPFTGLHPAQFHRLVRLVARRGGDAIADGRPGRPWALTLSHWVLLVAVCWRTNLIMRQLGQLFGSRTPPCTGSSTRWDRFWRWRRYAADRRSRSQAEQNPAGPAPS